MEKLTRKLKTVDIHGKQYIEVKERILALVENGSPYSIETSYDYFPEQKMWVVKAKLTMLETWEAFTWLAQEIEGNSNINKTSALENAETSAVGRACAFAGIGVIDSIASADEVHKAINREKPNGEVISSDDEKEWFWLENWEKFKVVDHKFTDPTEAVKKARKFYKVSIQWAYKMEDYFRSGEDKPLDSYPKK